MKIFTFMEQPRGLGRAAPHNAGHHHGVGAAVGLVFDRGPQRLGGLVDADDFDVGLRVVAHLQFKIKIQKVVKTIFLKSVKILGK